MNKDNKLEKHWKRHFNYNYFGSYSLDEGQEVIRTIEKLGNEDITDHITGEINKSFIAHFVGENGEDVKPMYFNKTNCRILEDVYGSDPQNWIGKDIQIFVKKRIKTEDGVIDGLRIRNFVPTEISIYNEQTQRLINFINTCNSKTNLETVKKHCTIEYTENLYKTKLKTLKK